MVSAFTAAAVFVAGVAVGLAVSFLGRAAHPAPAPREIPSRSRAARPAPPARVRSLQTERAASGGVVPADTPDRGVPPATVEVVYADPSEEAAPDLAAAHRARRAKRAATRAAQAEKRHDFLATLNLDLLTADQQRLHAEYTEAVKARDAARREADDLRACGEDVPEALQKRLAEAESVVRADAAEERRALREAAARARGLDEESVRTLLEDLENVDLYWIELSQWV